jgi:hypothetical protein
MNTFKTFGYCKETPAHPLFSRNKIFSFVKKLKQTGYCEKIEPISYCEELEQSLLSQEET